MLLEGPGGVTQKWRYIRKIKRKEKKTKIYFKRIWYFVFV